MMSLPEQPDTNELQRDKTDMRRLFLRPLAVVLLVMLALILILTLTSLWVVTTASGTATAVAMLQRMSSVKLLGVTGSVGRDLRIQQLQVVTPGLTLSVDGVELQWQPAALYQGRVQVDMLHIRHVRLGLPLKDATAVSAPLHFPGSLALPWPLRQMNVDQLSLDLLQVVTADAKSQVFSSMKAKLTANVVDTHCTLSGNTPWGSAAFTGKIAAVAPFLVDAHVDWQGGAMRIRDVTMPAYEIQGTVTGDLRRFHVIADVKEHGIEDGMNAMHRRVLAPLNGTVDGVITPFSPLPLESMRVTLAGVNPANFYAAAPMANLLIEAHVGSVKALDGSRLEGKLTMRNFSVSAWNKGGIPVSALSTQLHWSSHEITWQDMQVLFSADKIGSVRGSGRLLLGAPLKSGTMFPDFSTQFVLQGVDLLQLDTRLKSTRLDGKVQINGVDGVMALAVDVEEKRAEHQARLRADVAMTRDQVIQVKKVELLAGDEHHPDGMLTAVGSYSLRAASVFGLQVEVRQLDPARWINVPAGRIGGQINLEGQMHNGWRVSGKLAALSGQFAGLNLHGDADVSARQGQWLQIKKMDVNWGKNQLVASGSLNLAGGTDAAQLQIKLVLPDLAELRRPFAKLLPEVPVSSSVSAPPQLSGAIFVDGLLSGDVNHPSGHIMVRADRVVIPDLLTLAKLQTTFTLTPGKVGKFEGDLTLAGLTLASAAGSGVEIAQVQANLSGVRRAHRLQVAVVLPHQRQIELLAEGDLNASAGMNGVFSQWQGKIQALNVSGSQELRLSAPVSVFVSMQKIQIGPASWEGSLGKLQLQQLFWSPGQLVTRGGMTGLDVVALAKMLRSDLPITGTLKVDASWQLELGRRIAGQFGVVRRSGDVLIVDPRSSRIQPLALGLQTLTFKGQLGHESVVSSLPVSSTPIALMLQLQGAKLGRVSATVSMALPSLSHGSESPQRHSLETSPLSGSVSMNFPDILWLSPWVSELTGSGVALRGDVHADATLSGTLAIPDYRVKINAKKFELGLTDLGVLLPNGSLDALVQPGQLTLSRLHFSQIIKAPPRHEHLREMSWVGQTGEVEASGVVDTKNGTGSIAAHWNKFPFLQSPDRWLVASGDAQLIQTNSRWNLTGQLAADAAYFAVPKQASPKLSGDVVIVDKNAKKSSDTAGNSQAELDFNLLMGDNFIFVGRGLDTRLTGDLRIHVRHGGALVATGSIQTSGGSYEGYGQKLSIERGILNFQGPLDNPGLNVSAMRRGLAVEAGIAVVGTVARPQVQLISEPSVPDADKLSWLVLGHASDQMAGSESGLLLAAAGAIFGGDNGKNVPRELVRGLGFDDFSVASSSSAPGSQLPVKTVAGDIAAGSSTNDQVFSVGKRLSPSLTFSIERSLSDATNGLKLTWQLTRRISIIGRAGSDTAIDGQYTFSFD